ncbi:hypothetical protein CDAR_568751, partial [Caerostris darwini]
IVILLKFQQQSASPWSHPQGIRPLFKDAKSIPKVPMAHTSKMEVLQMSFDIFQLFKSPNECRRRGFVLSLCIEGCRVHMHNKQGN